MVQILRTGGPQTTVHVTGPKKGLLEGLLEPAARGFSRGLGEGLSESFQDYFDEQQEKKYNSIVDEALSKYQSEDPEGEITPEQMLKVSYDRKLDLRDKDRERLRQEAQTMAVVQRNEQLENKNRQLQAETVTPEQEERAISALQTLDPSSATAADAYNVLRRNAGLNQRQAKPFVDQIFLPEKKRSEKEHEGNIKNFENDIKAARRAAEEFPSDKERAAALQRAISNRSRYIQERAEKRVNNRFQNSPGNAQMQRGMNFGIASARAGEGFQPQQEIPGTPGNEDQRRAELREGLRGGFQ